MNRRLEGTISLILGVCLVIAGSFLVLFPGISLASPSFQRDPFTDEACLNCHTDQSRLEELTANTEADEPEESSLSSGPG